MIVTRWQAQVVPDKEQIKRMFQIEGLEPHSETLNGHSEIKEHRHPFDEVRMVAEGELMLNISGTKLLLRAGDKIMIPSNTKHSKEVNTDEPCVCICANKTS